MKITQVHLENYNGIHQVCWLPSDEYKLKPGTILSLKGDDSGNWKIMDVYTTQEHYEINRKWDVGGL